MSSDPASHSALYLTLDSPQTRNALSKSLVDSLCDAIGAAVDRGRRALVIRSSGPAFAAGVDLRQVGSATDESLRESFRNIQRLLDALYAAPIITIAVINGPAIGAGADLALACTHRLGSRRARFRFPGPQFGLLLGTRRLAQETSAATAERLALTGATVEAESALRLGLLTSLVEADQLDTAARELATAAEHAVVDIAALRRAAGTAAPTQPAGLDRELLESSMTPGLAQRMKEFRQNAGGRRR